jgi:hypothetical protein
MRGVSIESTSKPASEVALQALEGTPRYRLSWRAGASRRSMRRVTVLGVVREVDAELVFQASL